MKMYNKLLEDDSETTHLPQRRIFTISTAININIYLTS